MTNNVKPQFTIQDMGYHNNNLEETSARLLKGNSWKKQRIIVIIPAGDTIPAKVALSHWNLAFPPNNGVVRILAQGMEVGEAYSNAIENILADPNLSQWEYILTLEHDNVCQPDTVIKLLESMENNPDLSCISALYFLKGMGGVAQIWGSLGEPYNFMPQIPDPNGGIVRCRGTGMGCALWKLSMFKDPKLRKPWFKTLPNCTQDLYFWGDANKWGYRCGVDCSIKCGHYDLDGSIGGIPDFTW